MWSQHDGVRDLAKKKRMAFAAAALMAVLTSSAHAASVSYFLDQTNLGVLPDGVNYLEVTISDSTTMAGDINFKVEALGPLTSIKTTGFGIDQFGFNTTLGLTGANFVLPTNWTNIGAGNMDGFGSFSYRVDANGAANRVTTLEFSITGITNDTIYSYINPSANTAGQGNTLFAAHVGGFTTSDPNITSGYFGGSTPVPLPAAAWLFGSGLLGLFGFARRRKA